MRVEIHVNNLKSQIVVFNALGQITRFPSTSQNGLEVVDPVVAALENELTYYVETMFMGSMKAMPVHRFSIKTYKFDTGCISNVTKVLNTFGVEFKIVDKRVAIPPGIPIPLRPGVVPRPYQADAVEKGLKAGRGIFRLATGAGKTFIGANLLGQLNLPSVVFVHTLDLLDQFKSAIEFFLNIEVGQIGGGIVNPKNFTIVMLQTAIRAFDQKYVKYEVDPDDDDYDEEKALSFEQKAQIRTCVEQANVVLSDECFVAGTLVLDANGIPRPIETFENESSVLSSDWGFSSQKVSNVFNRQSDDNRIIKTASTIHTTSANHKWWVYDSKVCDFIKKASADLIVGDCLLSVAESPHTTLNDLSVEQAQFLALIACNGHSEKSDGTIKVEASKDIEYFRQAFKSITAIKQTVVRERESKRSRENPNYTDTIVFSSYDNDVQAWLVANGVPRGDKSAIVDIPDQLFVAPLESIRKYVSTVFCCEGSVGARRISIQMASKVFIKKLQLLLLKFGIRASYSELDYKNWKTKHKYKVSIHYRLDIFSRGDLERFSTRISLDIDRKQRALQALLDGAERETNEVVLGNALLGKYIRSFGLSLSSLWRSHRLAIRYPEQNPRDTIAKRTIQRVLEILKPQESSMEQQQNRKILEQICNVRFDEILRVEKNSEPITVYDFTVANTHKFIAQTNITSNCHHLSCSTLQTLFKVAKNAYYRYGLTATLREDGADLLIHGVTGKIISDVSASFLIEHNPPYLVRPHIYYIKVQKPRGTGGGNYQQRYRDDIVENEMRNELIVQSVMRLVKKGHRVLVLAKHIKHLKTLTEMMEEGFTSSWPDLANCNSKTVQWELATGQVNKVKRKEIIEAMRVNKLECLFASTIADEGLDCPPISAVILAGGGKSATKAFQRVGRALRLFETKDKAIIIDFYDQGKYFKKHAERRMELFRKEPAFIIKTQG